LPKSNSETETETETGTKTKTKTKTKTETGTGTGTETKTNKEITTGFEVFHVSNNLYDYEDAQSICKSFDSRLATYDDIEKSYNKGGEFCGY
jgi:hypothetical protein